MLHFGETYGGAVLSAACFSRNAQRSFRPRKRRCCETGIAHAASPQINASDAGGPYPNCRPGVPFMANSAIYK